MLELYELLGIERSASKAEIRKHYRERTYLAVKGNNPKAVERLHLAYGILMDDYKRSFYDRFGDMSLEILTQSGKGDVIARFVSTCNILCCFAYFAFILIGLFSSYFFYVWFKKFIIKHSLFILSGLFILPIMYSWYNLFVFEERERFILSECFFFIIPNHLNILIISLFLDNLVTNTFSMLNILLVELTFLTMFTLSYKQDKDRKFKHIIHYSIRIALFFISIFYPKTLIALPAAIALSMLVIIGYGIPISLSLFLLAYTAVMKFLVQIGKFKIIAPVFIILNGLCVGLLAYCLKLLLGGAGQSIHLTRPSLYLLEGRLR